MTEEVAAGGVQRSAWATALMPIVLHELNNATQFLGMLHTLAAQDTGGALLERSAGDLSDTAGSVEDLGLLLAILSTAAGTDLLLERRSPRGVLVVQSAMRKLIRRGGGDLLVTGVEELLGATALAEGWELPWAMGASLWIASEELGSGEDLILTQDARGWGASVGGGARMQAHVEAVGEVLAEVTGHTAGTEWSFSVPAGWLAPMGSLS